jgi:RNA polymerase sigma-70 factor (ECF subfamily)
LTWPCRALDHVCVQGPRALATVFEASLPAGVGAPGGDLEGALGALYEAGRAAWPGVAVEAAAFARYLAERAVPPRASLPDVQVAADVYLACACAGSAPGAVAAFDRHFAEAIGRAIESVDGSPAFVDEARQVVRERLFVSTAGALPKIAEYGGRAPLRMWLRAVAVRASLNLRRGKADRAHDALDGDDDHELGDADPDIALLKAQYKADFEAAVRAAIARLSPRERTILRLHVMDGLGVGALGVHYGVGRSTAARWLAAAREALRLYTRAELTARLRLTPSEIESLAGLVLSQLEISTRGLLREGEASP